MEIFRTEHSFVLLCGESSLWIEKKTGELSVKPAWELANGHDPECLGIFFGLIGRVGCVNLIDDHILLVKDSVLVGELPSGHAVHKIKSIALLHPASDGGQDLGLKRCLKHHRSADTNNEQNLTNLAISKTWTSLKTATTNIKSSAQHSTNLQNLGKVRGETKEKERYQRRILEELQRIFTDTDSFYFCPAGGDITNSVYRQYIAGGENTENGSSLNSVDDRFFWNKHMLQDIIKLNSPLAEVWVMPIIQGYVEIKDCKLDFGENQKYEVFTVSLISRRNRHRVGTRYKRRGVNEYGHCANYVETEQIVKYKKHVVSFVQIRGSIPLYWSQQGYKYRPPPQLHKSYEENQTALNKHILEEIERYGPIVITNLVERSGKEAVIGDAYADHVHAMNNADITYVTFDFHYYCRGMRFENVSLLTDELQDEIAKMGYCWLDKHGLISKQNGVFRVNCVDCLDRTNVVQTALAREVLIIQLIKLGLMSPETPNHLFIITQQMWANNGDVISKQYAGTNALKGDITRTGGRKISGMMKDGMNSANRYIRNCYADYYTQTCLDVMQGNCPTSAGTDTDVVVTFIDSVALPLVNQFDIPLYPTTNSGSDFPFITELRSIEFIYLASRYYLSRFKDSTRQATLDIMLGNKVEDNVISRKETSSSSEEDQEDGPINEDETLITIDHIKQVLEDVKKLIVDDPSQILATWGLINADFQSSDNEVDIDAVLVLTPTSYFVADYDPELDKVTKFEEIALKWVKLLEIIVWNSGSSNIANSGSNSASPQKSGCVKRQGAPILIIHYNPDAENSSNHILQHNFKCSSIRFFNNVAVVVKNNDEKTESLRAIAETIQATYQVSDLGELEFNIKSVQRKSSLLSPDMYSFKPSDVQSSLKNVGSKALSNVSQQFSKFNKFGQSFKYNRNKPKIEKSADVSPVSTVDSSNISDSQEAFLTTAGIVLSNADIESAMNCVENKCTSQHGLSEMPEIIIGSNLDVDARFDKSQERINDSAISESVVLSCRSSSDKDLSLNLTTPGETTLRSIKLGFTTATNALVSPSSPLSKLAKGVQNLSSNLDPRKFRQERTATNIQPIVPQFSENDKLREKWNTSGCKSELFSNIKEGMTAHCSNLAAL